jgi:hypothetical protein
VRILLGFVDEPVASEDVVVSDSAHPELG